MNELLFRRRMMAAQGGGGGGGLSDYIQNGLVLHLDGISKGSGPSNSWTSIVGGHVFTNVGAVVNADNYEFGGNEYFTNTSFSTPSVNDGTIEAVCYAELSERLRLYKPATTKMICFQEIANGILYAYGTGSTSPYLTRTLTKASYSLSRDFRTENGVAMATGSSTFVSTGAPNNTNAIGRRGNYYFVGKLFSIRIYNRLLTQDEIMNNLAVDNIRFNLGLTL